MEMSSRQLDVWIWILEKRSRLKVETCELSPQRCYLMLPTWKIPGGEKKRGDTKAKP
jgi:hypothetical protein